MISHKQFHYTIKEQEETILKVKILFERSGIIKHL